MSDNENYDVEDLSDEQDPFASASTSRTTALSHSAPHLHSPVPAQAACKAIPSFGAQLDEMREPQQPLQPRLERANLLYYGEDTIRQKSAAQVTGLSFLLVSRIYRHLVSLFACRAELSFLFGCCGETRDGTSRDSEGGPVREKRH